MLHRNLTLEWTQQTKIRLWWSAKNILYSILFSGLPLVCLNWLSGSSLGARLQVIMQLTGKSLTTYCTYFYFFSTNIRMCCSSNNCASLCTWKHDESADYLVHALRGWGGEAGAPEASWIRNSHLRSLEYRMTNLHLTSILACYEGDSPVRQIFHTVIYVTDITKSFVDC